jgi:hypothetical protein
MSQAKTTFITMGALLALIVTLSWGCEPYYDRDYDWDRYGRYDRYDRDRDWRRDRSYRYSDRDDWRRDRDRDWRYGKRGDWDRD